MGPPTLYAARRGVLVEQHQPTAASLQQLTFERDAAFPGGNDALSITTHAGATRAGEEEGAAVKGPTPDAPPHKASAQTPSNAEETSRRSELEEGTPPRIGAATATGRRGVTDTGAADRQQSVTHPAEPLGNCGKKGKPQSESAQPSGSSNSPPRTLHSRTPSREGAPLRTPRVSPPRSTEGEQVAPPAPSLPTEGAQPSDPSGSPPRTPKGRSGDVGDGTTPTPLGGQQQLSGNAGDGTTPTLHGDKQRPPPAPSPHTSEVGERTRAPPSSPPPEAQPRGPPGSPPRITEGEQFAPPAPSLPSGAQRREGGEQRPSEGAHTAQPSEPTGSPPRSPPPHKNAQPRGPSGSPPRTPIGRSGDAGGGATPTPLGGQQLSGEAETWRAAPPPTLSICAHPHHAQHANRLALQLVADSEVTLFQMSHRARGETLWTMCTRPGSADGKEVVTFAGWGGGLITVKTNPGCRRRDVPWPRGRTSITERAGGGCLIMTTFLQRTFDFDDLFAVDL